MSSPSASDRASGVLGNALATLGGRGLAQLLRLAALLATMGALGPEGWGRYGLLVASLELARALTNFGLDTAAVRWMAVSGASSSRVLREVLALKTAFAAAGFVAIAVLRPGPPDTSPALLLLLGCGLFPQGWTGTLVARFQAEHRMRLLIPVQAGVGLAHLGAVATAAWAQAGVATFVVLLVAADFTSFLVTALVARFTWPEAAPAPGGLRLASLRQLCWEGLPLGIVELVVIAYMRFGVFLLQEHGGTRAAGQLFAAMKLNEQTMIVASALAVSALPVFSRLALAGAAAGIARSFLRYSAGALAFSVLIAGSATLFARPIVLSFKPDYAEALPPLIVFAWAGVFMFQNQLSSSVINAYGKFRWVSLCALLNLANYVALALVLVPREGARGAALATLGTEAVNAAVQLGLVAWLVRSRRPSSGEGVAPALGQAA